LIDDGIVTLLVDVTVACKVSWLSPLTVLGGNDEMAI
jgi:hypothetical protein